MLHKILANYMKLHTDWGFWQSLEGEWNNVALLVLHLKRRSLSLTCALSDATRTKIPPSLLHSFSQHAVWCCGDNLLVGAVSTIKHFLTDDFPTVFPCSLYCISDSYTSSLPLHLFHALHSHSTLLAKYSRHCCQFQAHCNEVWNKSCFT